MLDKDSLQGLVELALQLHGDAAGARDDNSFYRDGIMPLEYDVIWRLVQANVGAGLTVVVDAPFAQYQAQPDYLDQVADKYDLGDVLFVTARVQVHEATLLSRLQLRGLKRDEWKIANWSTFWAETRAQQCRWRRGEIVAIQNDDGLDVQALCRTLRARVS